MTHRSARERGRVVRARSEPEENVEEPTIMSLLARDIMKTEVHTVSPAVLLPDLERRFIEHRVGGFPVVERTKLVGIVTRSDVIRALTVEHAMSEAATDWFQVHTDAGPDTDADFREIAERAGVRIDKLRVRDVMAKSVITVSPETPITEVARVLVERRFHRVLVTNGTKLVGVISSLDFVRLFADGRVAIPA
jgi:CBS domain-containing protein